MKIGIVGCGLNSDYHIHFAKTYPDLEIAGLVDIHEERAKKCADRHGIPAYFNTIRGLVEHKKPDVIHIVTPPFTHFQLAEEALRLGCHTLIEKPMTLTPVDAEILFDLANQNGVMVCSMHNHFFDPCMEKAKCLILEGRAGRIINIESYYGLNTRIDAFRKYPAPNVLPWIYSLPGGVFHDFIAHSLYVMLPYTGRPQSIQVMEKSFGELPQNISDELRILINGEKAFGVLTISFAAKPHQHFLKVYGTRMMIHVNFNTMTTTCHPVSSLPKAVQKATYNLSESRQLLASTISNVWNFGTGKLRPYQGMKILIHRFYDAVQGAAEVPVSKREALEVVEVAEKILKQVRNTKLSFEPFIAVHSKSEEKNSPLILVTGATGFLGTRLIETLIRKGYRTRALARQISNIETLKKPGTEIYFGDVADLQSLEQAFEGVDVVVHAAADTAGDEEGGRASTVHGTKNVVNLCLRYHVGKLVYISTCNVYATANYKKGQVVNESSFLERHPENRGHYTHAKFQAEQIVIEAMKHGGLPATILRPGTIFGPGGEIFTPMMGFALGSKIFAIIGRGDLVLPLIFIDNLADAIVTVIGKQESSGKIYNVVDQDNPTKRKYVDTLLRRLYPKAKYVYIPYGMMSMVVRVQEFSLKALGRSPFLTRYRLKASQNKIQYESGNIRSDLNWKPPYSFDKGVERVIRFMKQDSGAKVL